jgi:SPP1 gp7 family putative phage head morphogenesis protein
VDYLKAKGFDLPETFDWRDMWQADHATAFTVAKSAGFDILKDISDAVTQAKEQGWTFKKFSENLTPVLQSKGWWGRQEVADTKTGEPVSAQLGSPRRLRIIYDTNMRMAHAAGTWARIERLKGNSPFLRYVAILDGRTRPLHRAWNGTVLPWDHAWWKTHFPPNGWHCRCSVMQLSQRDLDEFGYKVTDAPPSEMIPWTNDRTGDVIMTPKGVDPGFGYNPGQVAIQENAARALMGKLADATPDMAAAQMASAKFVLPAVKRDLGTWISGLAEEAASRNFQARGERRVVGALSEPVVDFLKSEKGDVQSGALSLIDGDVKHMLRDAKKDAEKALPDATMAELPTMLESPKAVYWDKQGGVLLYLYEVPGGMARITVQVNYGTELKGGEAKKRGRVKFATNNVKTVDLLKQFSEFKSERYVLLEGGV